MINRLYESSLEFWYFLRSFKFSHIRREYFGWYTKKEMTLAYKEGVGVGANDPTIVKDREKVSSFAEFYITMDLFVDAD